MDKLEEDPDPLNIEPEITMMRASAAYFFEKSGPSPMAVDMLEKATRAVDLRKKHVDTSKITLESVARYAQELGAAVVKHVKDPKILAKIEKDWALVQIV